MREFVQAAAIAFVAMAGASTAAAAQDQDPAQQPEALAQQADPQAAQPEAPAQQADPQAAQPEAPAQQADPQAPQPETPSVQQPEATDAGPQPPEQPALQIEEQRFRDWLRRCEFNPQELVGTCFAYTGNVMQSDAGEVGARIIVGIDDADSPIVLIEVPDSALPEGGVGLRVDSNDPLGGPFKACNVGACQAAVSGEVAQVLTSQFRAGAQVVVAYRLSEGQSATVPMSLMGFTAAFNDMVRRIREEQANAAAVNAAAAQERDAGGAGDAAPDQGAE